MAITKEQVLNMDWKSIQAAIKNPTTSAEMQNLLRDRQVVARVSELMLEAQNQAEKHEAEIDAQLNRVVPPSTEALAAEANAMVAEPIADGAPVVQVPPVAPVDFTEDDKAWAEVGVTVVRDAGGKATRYIEEYQVLGEDGKPIGRPTHLEARTLPELASKKREVHTQATRAFHRLKQQKLTFKKYTILSPEAIAEAAKQALEAKDLNAVTEVVRGIIETQYQKEQRELREKQLFEDGRAISNEFRARHLHDYNPCVANQNAIGEYFAEHNLEFTLDNLEVAFQDLKDQGKLAPVTSVAGTRTATVAANPAAAAAAAAPAPPVIPVAEPPVAAPASATPAQPQAVVAPVVEATAPTPAAAPNVQPAARRPGVNGSLPPGTLSAQRPGAPEPALARKEFLKMVKDMKPEVMKQKLKTDPQFVKQLEAHGIRVR